MCIVAAPEGVARIRADHPDVDIFTAALDERLNDQAYIYCPVLVMPVTVCSAQNF